MCSTVRWVAPRGLLTLGSRRAMFAASHAAACSRNSSTVTIVSPTSILPEVVQQAGRLVVERRLTVERRVERQSPQEQVEVVIPRERDAAEGLPAIVGERDA